MSRSMAGAGGPGRGGMPSVSLLVLLVTVFAAPAGAQDWRMFTTMREVAGEDMLRVDVEYGAGRFQVAPGEGSLLYRANVRYDADVFQPVTSYEGNRLKLGFEGGNVRGRNLRSGHLDLKLGTSIPIALDLKFGASEAEIELGGLRVREAHIKTGASRTELRVSRPNPEVCQSIRIEVGAATFRATQIANLNAERITLKGGVGEVTLDFTGEWRTDMTADIEMGLGALTLRVPDDLGVRVRRTGFLTGFDSQRLIKRGDVYFSENWEQAQHRLTINLDASLGTIRLAWIGDQTVN